MGCAGRITSFSETPDNRFLITLTGVCRFAITRELEADGLLYRRVSADYSRFAGDLPEPAPLTVDRGRLLPALRSYFDHHGLTADWDAIERAADDALVTCLAMACPFEPRREAGAPRVPGRERAPRHDAGAVRDVGPRGLGAAVADAVREAAAMTEERATVDPKLLEILVCPVTKESLRYDAERQELISDRARLAFPIRDGIPIMLPDEARPLEEDETK